MKTYDEFSQEVRSLKSAVALLADAEDARKMMLKCVDILEILTPLSDIPSKIGEISTTVSGWDIRLKSKLWASLFYGRLFRAKSKADEERLKVVSWLSPLNEEMKFDDICSQRQDGTRSWFFNNEIFMGWVDSELQRLQCPRSRTSKFSESRSSNR